MSHRPIPTASAARADRPRPTRPSSAAANQFASAWTTTAGSCQPHSTAAPGSSSPWGCRTAAQRAACACRPLTPSWRAARPRHHRTRARASRARRRGRASPLRDGRGTPAVAGATPVAPRSHHRPGRRPRSSSAAAAAGAARHALRAHAAPQPRQPRAPRSRGGRARCAVPDAARL